MFQVKFAALFSFVILFGNSLFAQPANDDPCAATVVTVGSSCSFSGYTNAAATGSVGIPAPGCASYSGGDVWFQVTVPPSGNLTFDSNTGVMTDGGMAIYSGTCGALSLIACNDDGSVNGLMPMIAQTGLTPGSTIWIRFWEFGNNNNGTFSLCVFDLSAPANDDPCAATVVIVGASCTFSTYTNDLATATAGPPAPGCASYSGGDVWFQITVPASGSVTFDSNSGVMTDGGMAIYSGTCGALTLIACDDDGSTNGAMPMITQTGLTPGATIWIRFWEFGNNNNGTFSLCVYDPVVPGGPANDDPCAATVVTVGASCTFSTYTNANATTTAGPPAPGCASFSGGDVWFQITVPASGNVTFDSNTGVVTDGGMAIYSGTCGALTLIACDDDGSTNGAMPMITQTGLTPGATIWIRFWEFGNNNNGTFSLCVFEPIMAGTPANDDPCSATALAVGATCVFLATTNAGATATAGVPAPGCANYSGGDVWFTAVVPAGGWLIFDTGTGVITDGGMAIYSGTCGALTLIECDDDDSNNGAMSMINNSALTPGSTVWIRVWEYGNDNNGSFNICVSEGSCAASSNDFCQTPAILTQGAGNWSSTTSPTYTQDQPGNLTSVFCGSIENNSWYQFSASATTEVFNITSVTNCTNGWGIQAQVYSVSTNVAGCCTAFSSVSNCFNPGTSTIGSVTASGLTIGNTYYLMIDGNAGDDCDFTVSGWTATGILPVTILNFQVDRNENENVLSWISKSELNNDFYFIEKSNDGVSYQKIGNVDGAGNSSVQIEYSFTDADIYHPVIYYRLSQVDFDGTTKKLGTVSIIREIPAILIYPNPASNVLNFSFSNSIDQSFRIEFIDISGRIISEEVLITEGVFVSTEFGNLEAGVYMIRVVNTSGNTMHLQKIVKK